MNHLINHLTNLNFNFLGLLINIYDIDIKGTNSWYILVCVYIYIYIYIYKLINTYNIKLINTIKCHIYI